MTPSSRLPRRALLAAGAIALPGAARAQQGARARRVGFLNSSTAAPTTSSFRTLAPHFARLGLVLGETLLVRAPEGEPASLPSLAADLVRRDVSVIVAVGAPAVLAAAAATRSVPIVAIDLETNPVAAGLAQSLARPGRNVTGLFLDQPSLAAKWVDLLRETLPGMQRVVLLWDTRTGRDQLDAAIQAAEARQLPVTGIDWMSAGGVAAALAPLAGQPVGVILMNALGFGALAPEVGAAARRLRLPMLAFTRPATRGGILMSYGVDQPAHFGRAAGLLERILAGAPPGDLPIELPTRFELTLDLLVARELDIAIPTSVFARADEVLE